MPRGAYQLHANNLVTQEYALYCRGQFVAQAHGEQTYGIGQKSLATALEGAKSNALMRCCKDIGIASELWDPNYIHKWKQQYAIGVWCEHSKTNQKKILYRRKDRPALEYPYKEIGQPSTKSTSTKKSTTAPETTEVDTVSDEFMDTADVADEYYSGAVEEDSVPSEEATPAEPTKTKRSFPNQKFGQNETITFGKYKGKTWGEAMKKSDFEGYLRFLSIDKTGSIPDLAREALVCLKKRA